MTAPVLPRHGGTCEAEVGGDCAPECLPLRRSTDFALGFIREAYGTDYMAGAVAWEECRTNREGYTTWLALMLDEADEWAVPAAS